MDNSKLKQTIYELEEALTLPDVRRDAERVGEIILEDFFEFCSSGAEYRYSPGDVFNDEYSHEISEFEIKKLGRDHVLATYKAARTKQDSQKEFFLRSSIWEFKDGKWRIVFHQGTPAKM